MSDAESNASAGRRAVQRPRRRWLTVVGLVVIFLSGGVLGSALTVILRDRAWPRPRRTLEETRDRLTERIAGKLRLSGDQTEQLRQIVGDRLTEIRQLRRQIQPETERVAKRLRQRVAALLTDEQKSRWAELYAELFERWFLDPASTRPASQPGGA